MDSYYDCANALLIMWMENVITDGEYKKLIEKLNTSKMAPKEKSDGSKRVD